MYDFFKPPYIESSKIHIIVNEILNLFNTNTKFVSLCIHNLSHIYITGGEYCFSDLKYVFCDVKVNSGVLDRLAITNTSIKGLKIQIDNNNNNPGIVRLIEAQKDLKEVNIFYSNFLDNTPYCKTLEKSLVKFADTIQYLKIDWIPITNYLSYLVNLVSLKIQGTYNVDYIHLKNVVLPNLKILNARHISAKILARLIENTKGQLIEISILFQRAVNNEMLIQAIYKNCPNLSYLQLSMNSMNIPEIENMLIHCQFLTRLEIMESDKFYPYGKFNWDKLLGTLTRRSPISLFKFKFFTVNIEVIFEALKLFLNDWKDRHPMTLYTIPLRYGPYQLQQLVDLLQMYKVEGIIKNYDIRCSIEDIECIQLI
jgi:hypothetical protein